MNSISSPARKVKPGRSVRLVSQAATGAFAFCVSQGKAQDRYVGTPVPADFGTGYRVEKAGEPQSDYHVLLADAPGSHSCECLGWLRHGRCRHVSSILALKSAGKIG